MRFLEHLRRVRAEALGLNRRNLDLLQAYNRAALTAVADHKQRTKETLAKAGLPVPDTYAVCARPTGLSAFGDEMEGLTEFVLKPARGAGGEGIVVVAGREDRSFRTAGGGLVRRKDLEAHAADILAGAYAISQAHDDALLEYRLRSSREVEPLSPGGVADVRIVAFRGVPVMAMLRLPTIASRGRANLHSGGIGVGIGIATGQTGEAIRRGRAIAAHPDTGAALRGWAVPYWDEMLLLAARAFDALPLGYFGIDIVLDASRGPVVLELNARPGLSIQLATGCGLRPILDEIRRFDRLEERGAESRAQLARELASSHALRRAS